MQEFIPHRFQVNLFANDNLTELVCRGAFSEVSGLEASMSPIKVKEGGRNWGEVQLAGITTFPPIVLKRGMTEVEDLWKWFEFTTQQANYGYRLHGEIQVLASDDIKRVIQRWTIKNVMATKFKGPDLSANASSVAIEELHLVHDNLVLTRPTTDLGQKLKSAQSGVQIIKEVLNGRF